MTHPASAPTFGKWLKARRKELDLTRAQLASQIGCAAITLEKVEQEQRRPSQQIAALLAQALSIPQDARADFIRLARAGEAPSADGQAPSPKASAPPTNLPGPLTSFIDRTRELAEVRAKLLRPDVRLLTLVGPPGIGKTRLSIQTGQTLLDQFADGAWFVALAPIIDPANVLPAIARVFDIAEGGATPLTTRLQDYLRQKELLLVLDNFEQLLSEVEGLDAASAVTDLLEACRGLNVMATSRVPLRVYGEHVYPMPALSLPPRDKKHTVEQLAEFDATKLFVARAEAVQPGFALNADNAQAVADICLRLDGVPLAIELAASRLRQFTPPKLREALNQVPLQTLTVEMRNVEPRQRTLRNAIQWSYDLLDPAERAAFGELGVFAGGCTAEAALAVCELGDDSILHALADRSLIKRDANERWTMLEMIREFALEQLAGDALQQARQRHAEYYARFVIDADGTGDDAFMLRTVNPEQHNAHAALRWLIDQGDALAGGFACSMVGFWEAAERSRWLKEVLESRIVLDLQTRALLCYWMSNSMWQLHDFQAAFAYAHQAQEAYRKLHALQDVNDVDILIGRTYIEMGDCARARDVLLEALTNARSMGDARNISLALALLGEAELTLGAVTQAEACYRESHALCMAPGWQQHVSLSLACDGLGEIALMRHEYDHALAFLRMGVAHGVYPRNRTLNLDSLAGVIGTMPRRTTADIQRAAKIWGATQALRGKIGAQLAPGNRKRIDVLIAETRSRIAPKTFAAAWAEGRELSLDEAIALAMME